MDNTNPYIPSHHYKYGPKMCPCGHHEGYHDDHGRCLLAQHCECQGLPDECFTKSSEYINLANQVAHR